MTMGKVGMQTTTADHAGLRPLLHWWPFKGLQGVCLTIRQFGRNLTRPSGNTTGLYPSRTATRIARSGSRPPSHWKLSRNWLQWTVRFTNPDNATPGRLTPSTTTCNPKSNVYVQWRAPAQRSPHNVARRSRPLTNFAQRLESCHQSRIQSAGLPPVRFN